MTLPAWVRGALLLGVTLAAGIAIGVGYERRRAPAHHEMAMDAQHVLQHFSQRLDLDSAQYRRIAEILTRRQATVDSTWHALRPHLHSALDSTMREILGVLREDQVARYRGMVGSEHPGIPH